MDLTKLYMGQDYERAFITWSYLSIVQTGFQDEILAEVCIYFMCNHFNLAICTADVFFTRLQKLLTINPDKISCSFLPCQRTLKSHIKENNYWTEANTKHWSLSSYGVFYMAASDQVKPAELEPLQESHYTEFDSLVKFTSYECQHCSYNFSNWHHFWNLNS